MPSFVPSGYDTVPELWNESSPQVTHYAHLYEREGLADWNNRRICLLARSLGITVWVLMAQAGCFKVERDEENDLNRLVLDKTFVLRCWEKNEWPAYLTIHFDKMDRFVKVRDMKSATIMGVHDVMAARLIHKARKRRYG